MSALALALIVAAHAADVVVLRDDVAPGTPLTARDLVIEDVPTVLLTDGPTFKRVADAVGRVPVEWLYTNEVLRGERLAPEGAKLPDALLRPGEALATVTIDVPVDWVPLGASVDVAVRKKDALGAFGCRAAEAARILVVTSADGRATSAVLAVREGSNGVDGAVATLSLRSPSDSFVGSSPPTCDAGPPAPPEQLIGVGRSLLIPVGPDVSTIAPERFGIVDATLHEGYLHVLGLAEGTGRVAIETPWGDDVRVFRVASTAEWSKTKVAEARTAIELPAGGGKLLTEPTTWWQVADPAVATLVDVEGGKQLLVGTNPGATDVALGTEGGATLHDVLVSRYKRDATYGPDIAQVGGKLLVELPGPAARIVVVDPTVVTTKLKRKGTAVELVGQTEGFTQVLVWIGLNDPIVKDVLVGRPSTVEFTKSP